MRVSSCGSLAGIILFLLSTWCAAETKAAASINPEHPVKQYHDGSVRDINAVGNRNVGCGRGLGNWYSLDKQIAMGKAYSQQVEQGSKLITDPLVTEYINRIGQNL